MATLDRAVPRRYHRDRTAYQDPSVPNDHIEEFIEEWNFQQQLAYRKAAADLAGRVAGEHELNYAKLEGETKERIRKTLEETIKLKEKRAKEEERIHKVNEKEMERLRKEGERLAAEEAERAAFEELIQPRPIPEHLRIHTAIIAKTGWGKTQLLQNLILSELKKDNPPSIVVLDSTGAMVKRIQQLAVFNGRLRDRLLIVDPEHSPALNMFDLSNPRFRAYSPEQREAVLTDLIGLFTYIFASKEYDLSGQQGLGFAYAVRLILSSGGYNLKHLRQLLEETPKGGWEQSPFAKDIRRLDEDARGFFEHHFYSDSLKATRASIARRIHTLNVIPSFNRMFSAASNALDLFSETQERGRVILVNTNRQSLGRDGYILFGRYIVARLFAAMFERSPIPERKRRPTHLIIDEASPYFDTSFDDLLTQVRQFGLKVTIAFQHLEQLEDKLGNAVAGQTSVKYIGGLSPLDEGRVADQIRCERTFLQDLDLDRDDPPRWSDWAVYADGLTKHPMKMRLPFFVLEREPQMTEAQHVALLARNMSVLRPVPPTPPRATPTPAPAPVRIAPEPARAIVAEPAKDEAIHHDPTVPHKKW